MYTNKANQTTSKRFEEKRVTSEVIFSPEMLPNKVVFAPLLLRWKKRKEKKKKSGINSRNARQDLYLHEGHEIRPSTVTFSDEARNTRVNTVVQVSGTILFHSGVLEWWVPYNCRHSELLFRSLRKSQNCSELLIRLPGNTNSITSPTGAKRGKRCR